jgi:cytochrome c oxidase subunit 4
MSSLFSDWSKREETILNVICLVLAIAFLGFAVANIFWAGDLLTIDSLFILAVFLMLAGLFLISPVMWARSRGMFGLGRAKEEEEIVDATPVHFEGSVKLFLSILGWLLGLTLIEVFLAYIHVPLHIMLTILIGLSIIKAALIMAYFMHLRFERLSLVITLVPMLVVCICLLFIFFPDSFRASSLRYRYTGAAPVEESK